MAIHWQIKFKSLRAGTDYTVNIYDDNFTGTPVVLNGGAQPFVTQEDDDEDMFTPIRTQSGYLRIVDDGKDAAGNQLATDWWKTLVPSTAMSAKVILTDGDNNTLWHGYMQTQNFSGELYGNPQEREFPVQCGLSVLDAVYPTVQDFQLRSFAYLLNFALTQSGLTFSRVYIQGGSDAREWLQTRFCWKNFLTEDDEGNIKSRYSVFQMLEDMCRFWGWTARTYKDEVYFTCADDQAEQTFLELTPAQLATLAADTTGESSIGTITNVPTAFSLNGDIFCSRENEDYVMRGPSKAVVKADCNEQSTIVEFAPAVIEKQMEAAQGGYHWEQGDGDMVGYYITPIINSVPEFGAVTDIQGRAYNLGSGFCRMQIYASKESSQPSINDMIVIAETYKKNNTAVVQVELETVYPIDYTGGSIILDGSLFKDMMVNFTDGNELWMNIGIGMTKATAKWWYAEPVIVPPGDIDCGWTATKPSEGFKARMENGKLYVCTIPYLFDFPYGKWAFLSTSIPVPDTPGFFGKIFIEIFGTTGIEPFCIGNLKIDFSRDKTEIPSNISEERQRPLLITDMRVGTTRYTAQNGSHASEEWNANCIFASDNNMEFGYGLLSGPTGGYVATVPYGQNSEHPEQHLANRVSNYWTVSKRNISTDLRYDLSIVRDVLPHQRVYIDGSTFIPFAISHEWRDDVTHISFAQL